MNPRKTKKIASVIAIVLSLGLVVSTLSFVSMW